MEDMVGCGVEGLMIRDLMEAMVWRERDSSSFWRLWLSWSID